jgi:hypothetical protein
LAVQPLACARVRLSVERDPPERRDHLNIVNGRLHYVQAIRRVKARSHVVDAAQSERDGFGKALLIERRLKRSADGGEGEECGDNDARAHHDCMVAHGQKSGAQFAGN